MEFCSYSDLLNLVKDHIDRNSLNWCGMAVHWKLFNTLFLSLLICSDVKYPIRFQIMANKPSEPFKMFILLMQVIIFQITTLRHNLDYIVLCGCLWHPNTNKRTNQGHKSPEHNNTCFFCRLLSHISFLQRGNYYINIFCNQFTLFKIFNHITVIIQLYRN